MPGRPAFGHGRVYPLAKGLVLIASYHPSQQNTQTGRLTQEMFDGVFAKAKAALRKGETP
jgi:uracil-DNA glycosylase